MTVKTPKRDLLKSFTNYLVGECFLADSTVVAYHRDMKHFFEWLGKRKIIRLTISDLADYVGWLHDRNYAPATLLRHVIVLRLFYRFLQLEGILQNNLAELLGNRRLWGRLPYVLSPKEVERLFTAPGGSSKQRVNKTGAFAKSGQHFSGKPQENMVEWLKTSSNG